MRITRPLAWLLILLALFTAGLLRQYHDLTPTSPFLAPAVGSLLFACVLFLFLVAVRERQIGSAPGPGIRLGSLTPILLMLLVEKWVSSAFYPPLFAMIAPSEWGDDAADAWFRLLCGAGLLAIAGLTFRFSRPAAAWVRARLFGVKPVVGIAAAAIAIGGAGAIAAIVSIATGSSLSVLPPDTRGPLSVVLVGQAAIALGEEVYYRGLVLGELLRLGPRLGLSSPPIRRWVALTLSSVLFGMEHVGGSADWSEGGRQLIFALALGALLGMIVLVTENLWFAASLHAWINWLLLGAAPRLGYGAAKTSLTPGASVSLTLIVAFLAAYVVQRRGALR